MNRPTQTPGIALVVDCLLNRGIGTVEDTRYFIGVRHDWLVATLMHYLDRHRHLLGDCRVEARQALNDRGVDFVIQNRSTKIGFQVKSHFDVTENEFSANVKRQFAESHAHGLDQYYILICAAIAKIGSADYGAKVTHLLNELSTFKNVNLSVYSPLNMVVLFPDPSTVSRDDLLKRQATTDDSLNEYERGYEHLPRVTDEELRHAEQRLEEFGIEWWEYPGGTEAFNGLQELLWKKQGEQFTQTFLLTLPSAIREQREQLARTAVSLLRQCRACRSWNRRSEYKLSSWLYHIPEKMIPYTSLPNLRRIVGSLEEYLEKHVRMASDTETL